MADDHVWNSSDFMWFPYDISGFYFPTLEIKLCHFKMIMTLWCVHMADRDRSNSETD